MDTATLRQRFLDYFESRGHKVVASAPLVPGNDPSLLFTNAGMVQFKDVFLGHEKRSYTAAASSQRCVRAGGKHNDLENVGYTARHHTFFEMLGNFSFGDYFKEAAIVYAWEFLTIELELPPEKLWVTVFDDDDEAADIWLEKIGVDPDRFGRMGEKDNFWAMGDTGPCGPCSEIFYDHGPDVAGGPPGSADEEGDRYVEIWNLVFMQFDRAADGTLSDLPKPSVDTGMGLERIAAVMQGVHSNYDIDLFQALIKAAAKQTGCKDLENNSLKVIADHIRACIFLIVDGVLPGNEGRGYVLRRIIRRALRHGYELGQRKPFFHKLAGVLNELMGEAYPELTENAVHVQKVLAGEEERFDETLSQGMIILEKALTRLDGNELPGDVAFTLYDTYGFPVDLTADIVRARGLSVDTKGFETEMDKQRERARKASKFSAADAGLRIDTTTEFSGYDSLEGSGTIIAIFSDGKAVDAIEDDSPARLVLDVTPFYAESGGQVGDTGVLSLSGSRFAVTDTQKSGEAHLHVGRLESGRLAVGDHVTSVVDPRSRSATVLNHSATHLLHAALRLVLGTHVTQKGSLVEPERLRFDFSHYEAVTDTELTEIEALVNSQIRANRPAETSLMSYDEAVNSGAVALFGEKYGDQVRVLKLGDFSVELCGGTHVARTGDIGLFRIVSETGIASGVRRIEAITGDRALASVNEDAATLSELAGLVKGSRGDIGDKVRQLVEKNKALEKDFKALRSKQAQSSGQDLAGEAREIGGIQVLAARMDDDTDAGALRETVDRMKDKLGTAVVVLGAATADGKVRLAAGVTKNATDRIRAGDLISDIADQVGGKGGGRPDFAQAGGSDPAALDQALAGVGPWVESRVN
ncbi:MAG: alanine--tRNA ligase [Chromatiales bacterium]|nr:alanine--tRNA ligase [Chromatiales bacterium]HJP03502.1 alanine--tRNA ligase [Gammaproteobacteria bacterium]